MEPACLIEVRSGRGVEIGSVCGRTEGLQRKGWGFLCWRKFQAGRAVQLEGIFTSFGLTLSVFVNFILCSLALY